MQLYIHFYFFDEMQAISIVEPDPGHTKLAVTRSALNAIARITNPIAVVAVRVSVF